MEPREILEKLIRREDLDNREIRAMFDCLVGESPGELKAALLAALRSKGESVGEIAGMAKEMRDRAVKLPDHMRQALDTCGTGGDGSRSLNLSTLSALTLSSMGVPVVKHGNRSVSSSSGSADLLEGLGLPLDLPPDSSAALFEETRFAFLFAPLYHPAMKSVGPVRKALQIRTIFNFLGPLSNPARVCRQILGVPDESRVRPFAEVLRQLGLTSAMVVHGLGDRHGFDEISPCGPTKAAYFMDGGKISEETWNPADLGISAARPDDLAVSGVEESMTRARAVLSGAGREIDLAAVSINAAAGLYIYGEAAGMKDGVLRVRSHLLSGAAARHLDLILRAAQRLKNNAR